MPKRIRTRNTININRCNTGNTGHLNNTTTCLNNINDIAKNIINYTGTSITNNFIEKNNNNITQLPLVELDSDINPNTTTIINNTVNYNIETFNDISELILQIPSLSEGEILSILNNFINPYLECGPFKLPPIYEFDKLIKLIDEKIKNNNNKPIYKLQLFRNILDVLYRSRSIYFYDIQLENRNKTLNNKISQLENTVRDYAKELAICKGELETGFCLAGTFGFKINKPKNLIYAQAILNITRAWYIYLYNTSKIEYDKYNGVKEFVEEKGKKNAYDELIILLDEKYKDIEDQLLEENNKLNSDKYTNNKPPEYCEINKHIKALILDGSFTMTQHIFDKKCQ